MGRVANVQGQKEGLLETCRMLRLALSLAIQEIDRLQSYSLPRSGLTAVFHDAIEASDRVMAKAKRAGR